MPEPACIILLNGPGSVGKTATARALQAITTEPFLHVKTESFIDMLPPTLRDHTDGLRYETLTEDGKPSTAMRTGPQGENLLNGMRHAVAAMARQHNNMIVDETLVEGSAELYRKLLAPFRLHIVGLFAPLDLLETREVRRGDRKPGLARWQYERVHRGVAYDLGIDTSSDSPESCAMTIKLALRL